MRIGGLQKFSLIDYPGKCAAVVFTQGCNFRCPYCHNPELVLPSLFGTEIPFEDVLSFLETRKGKLDGVVITGGEPTLHWDLPACAAVIKGMGFSVKLDTNGTNPDVIARLLEEGTVDFIAMDVKAPLQSYDRAAGVTVQLDRIRESIELIRRSTVGRLFRTTFDQSLLSTADTEAIRTMLGNEPYILQPCGRQQKRQLVADFDELAEAVPV